MENHVPTENPPHPIPTFCNISRQIPFSFQFSFSKIIILWFCLNSQWIGFLILVSRSREHPPASPIYSNSKDTLNFCENSQDYDVLGICSRYITLVWTHSKFTFTQVCKSTHMQICTRKQIFRRMNGALFSLYALVTLMNEYIFILNFSLPSRSSQLGEAHTNEIKHGIHPEK